MKGPSKYTLTDWADALIGSHPDTWNPSKGWDRLNFLAQEPDAIAVARDCRFQRLESIPNLNLLEWACLAKFPIEQLRFLVKVCGIKPSTRALTYIFDDYEALSKNKPFLCTHMLVQNGARFDGVRTFVGYAFAMHCEGTEKFNLLLLQHEHLWGEIMENRNYSSKTRFISQMRRMQNAIEILEDRVDNARLAAIAILNLRRRRWRPELRDVWVLVARQIIFPQTNLLDSRWSTKIKRHWVIPKIPGLEWAVWITFGFMATFVVLSLK
jgi:hypothetical protein